MYPKMATARKTPAQANCRGVGVRRERNHNAPESSATHEMVSNPTRLSMTTQGVSAPSTRVPKVSAREAVIRQAAAVRNPTTARPKKAAGRRSTVTVSGRKRASNATLYT